MLFMTFLLHFMTCLVLTVSLKIILRAKKGVVNYEKVFFTGTYNNARILLIK